MASFRLWLAPYSSAPVNNITDMATALHVSPALIILDTNARARDAC